MNKNDIVILGLLVEKPKHGYEIVQDIKSRGLEHWASINTASIYNRLSSLEDQGSITSELEKVGNAPDRKVFTITKAGKKSLAGQVVEALKSPNRVEDLLSLGVAFVAGADRKAVLKALKAKMELFQFVLSHVKEQCASGMGKIPYNWDFLIRKTIAHIKVEMKFYREFIGKVEKKEFL